MNDPQGATGEPVLELAGISKSFRRGFLARRQVVLRDLSLQIRRGEVFGLLGHNGAGKTTSLRIALGILHADGGSVRLFGEAGVNNRAKARVGFLPDVIGLYPGFNARDMMRFTGELFRMGGRDIRRRSAELLELVGLADHDRVKVGKYSKGMRQRLGIALAIMNDPDLLVLDEPYSGLDPIGRRDVRRLLLGLKRQGKTVIISSHIVPDVEALCDRVGVLSDGVIERCLDLEEIYRQKSEEVEITVGGIGGREAIGRTPGVRIVYATPDAVVVRCQGQDASASVMRTTLDAGGRVIEVKPLRFNLEDYIMEAFAQSGGIKGDKLLTEDETYAIR